MSVVLLEILSMELDSPFNTFFLNIFFYYFISFPFNCRVRVHLSMQSYNTNSLHMSATWAGPAFYVRGE
jgi:hypothetical protein